MSITLYYAEAYKLARSKQNFSETFGYERDLPVVLADTSFWWREFAYEKLERLLTLEEKQEFWLYCYQNATATEQQSPIWQDFYSQQIQDKELHYGN